VLEPVSVGQRDEVVQPEIVVAFDAYRIDARQPIAGAANNVFS
jgi:hypothetical protein